MEEGDYPDDFGKGGSCRGVQQRGPRGFSLYPAAFGDPAPHIHQAKVPGDQVYPL